MTKPLGWIRCARARGAALAGPRQAAVVCAAVVACSCSRLPAAYVIEAAYDCKVASFSGWSAPLEMRTSTSSLRAALRPVRVTNGPVAEALFLSRVPYVSVTNSDTEMPEGWLDGNGPWRGASLHHADERSPLAVQLWFEEAEPVPSGCATNRSLRLGGALGLARAPGAEVGVRYERFVYDGSPCIGNFETETWELRFKAVRAAGWGQWVNAEGGVAYESGFGRSVKTQARLGADWYIGRFVGVGGEVVRDRYAGYSTFEVTTWRARLRISMGSRLSLECYVGQDGFGNSLDDAPDDVLGASCTLRL